MSALKPTRKIRFGTVTSRQEVRRWCRNVLETFLNTTWKIYFLWFFTDFQIFEIFSIYEKNSSSVRSTSKTSRKNHFWAGISRQEVRRWCRNVLGTFWNKKRKTYFSWFSGIFSISEISGFWWNFRILVDSSSSDPRDDWKINGDDFRDLDLSREACDWLQIFCKTKLWITTLLWMRFRRLWSSHGCARQKWLFFPL